MWSTSSGLLQLVQLLLAALGLAELCCFFLIAPLLHTRHSALYHWSGSARELFVPVFLALFLVWSCIASLLLWIHPKRLPRDYVWLAIFFVSPALASYNWDLTLGGGVSSLTRWLFLWCFLGGAMVMIGRHLPGSFPAQVANFTSGVAVFFGLGAVLVLGQLAWYGWEARGLNTGTELHQRNGPSSFQTRSGRIVWIVFDELSYQQVYERRFPGLNLPAFDGLAAESSVLTQTIPAGIFTDRVLPSLMSGKRIDLVRSSASGSLWIHENGVNAWRAFDPHDTIFEDALRRGYSTRVAGWYVPYCRILPEVLDGCFWSYDIAIKNGMSSQGSLAGNVVEPVVSSVSGLIPEWLLSRMAPVQRWRARGAEMHIEDYESISRASEAVLRDRSASFVLLHFPVPHLGGIYNRATGEFTSGRSTYLDNLALADRCLAHLRAVLEETGQWDSSVVVVMGDHSWRMGGMVADSDAPRGEEMVASEGGRYDPRPVYVVKLAGQHSGTQVGTPFSAWNTRLLLNAMMQGDVRSSGDLAGVVHRLH